METTCKNLGASWFPTDTFQNKGGEFKNKLC
jgi:hypothetical protein